MDLNKQRRQGHAAWTLTYSWGMDIKHGHGRAPWTSITCCLSLFMSMLHVYVHIAYSCPCCTSMSMLHVTAHASCPCSCCMPVSVQHGYVPAAWT
jgi:hypothetical protein